MIPSTFDIARAVCRDAHRARRPANVLRAFCRCGFPTSGAELPCGDLGVRPDGDIAAAAWDAVGRFSVDGRELRPGDAIRVCTEPGTVVTGYLVGADEAELGIAVRVLTSPSEVVEGLHYASDPSTPGAWSWTVAPPPSAP